MKISESPPIRVIVHNHIQIQANRIVCNHSKRKIVQKRLQVEERLYKVLCLLGCKKSCIHLAKGICQVVYKVLILGV